MCSKHLNKLKDTIRIIYLEDYDMHLAQLLTSGVDLWLSTPLRPYEASRTSGMKAALNGVPSLSVLDGWWIEGHIEGTTGWSIGHANEVEDVSVEIASLYDKMERVIVPLFYGSPSAFAEIRRSVIAINGSFFNSQRMVLQYAANAYFPHSRIEVQQIPVLDEQHVS
jgi:starch phosphorylase